jgi:hypothetical protein
VTYEKNDRVTITDPNFGTLRLIVWQVTKPTNGGPAWVTMTDPDGYGRWRRPSTDVARGWGN